MVTQSKWSLCRISPAQQYCLIKYPDLFNWMNPSYKRIRFTNKWTLLVSNASSSGKNLEIYTAALQRELLQRGIENVKYDVDVDKNSGKSTNGDYFIVYCGAHNKQYKINYDWQNSCFTVKHKKDIVFKSKSQKPITETADYIQHNL